ncbi:MAG: hypothetical protein JW818_02660 [Pirellulales bacterium]|nr:hypothetical protein [Pirellulales bacterium]
MSPWYEERLVLGADEDDLFDPLCIERSGAMSEEEVAQIVQLCEAIGPGPYLTDDQATGEGTLVATLPDGRNIVSLAATGRSDDPAAIEAHARLICQARCLLLRLLSDRDHWQVERDALIGQIRSLEAALAPQKSVAPVSRRPKRLPR